MKKIERERLWVFSPVSNISFQVQYLGCKDEAKFVAALNKVLDSYDILKTKVIAEETGSSYSNDFFFEPTGEVHCTIVKDARPAEVIFAEQEKRPMDIFHGEYIRLFYNKTESGFRLVLLTHHILGDGLSFAFLFEKILYVLADETIEQTPVDDFDFKSLLQGTKLGVPIRLLMRIMNHKWRKTGCFYTKEDAEKINAKYWKNHSTYTECYCLDKEAYHNLLQYSKNHKQTVNTLIINAFLKADESCKSCGLAVSVRANQDKSMGLDATGISVDYQYKAALSFDENAENIRKGIHKKSDNPNYKFFLINFLLGMEQSLLDAIYFSATGLSDNKVAKQFADLFGYSGNTKQGLSVTNLRVLPIDTNKGDITLSDVIFAPPLVLNAKRLIGVATTNERMWFTLQVEDNAEKENQKKVFEQAMKILGELKD